MTPRIRKHKVADTPTGPSGLVASAMQVATQQSKIRRAFKREDWQNECWTHFDNIGEYRYAQTWLAMAGSRADLVVEQRDPGTGEWAETTTGPAAEYLNELLEGCGGKSQFLYTQFLHLGVPGESFILGQDILNTIGEVIGYRWRVVEAGELDLTSTPPKVTDPQSGEQEPIGDGALIIRVWRPHPKDAGRADSASHAVLPVLREIENISKHIGATVDSRLAGNGVWILPREVSITTADGVTVNGDALADTNDPFMKTLVETMTRPISDRDDPSAVVPILLRMPGEFIQAAVNGHIKFGTDFDAQAQPLREAAIRRLALGLEMPPEQLLGLGDTNHWSAWQIEEAGVKTGIEPVLQLVVDALTRQYLVPLLKVAGVAGEFRVAYRTDKLILRPNRAQDAKAGVDAFLLAPKAWREAAGFDETDAPSMEELAFLAAVALVKAGHTGADQVVGALLGLPKGSLPDQPIEAKGASPAPGPTIDAAPAVESGDSGTPSTDTSARPAPGGADTNPTQSALLAACEPLVLRALERAGSKLRTRADVTQLASVPLHETHLHRQADDVPRLLAGAWSLVPSIAALHDVDAAALTAALNEQVAELLTHRQAYAAQARSRLRARLAVLPIGAAA